MKPQITYCPDMETLSRTAAEICLDTARESVAHRDRFTLVLAGGRSPTRLYEILAEPGYRAAMPWDKTHIFWGDERCVPRDHPDSNYRAPYERMLSKVGVPPGNIHRMPGEITPVDAAARRYEEMLREFFDIPESGEDAAVGPGSEGRFPVFDLILLGMGDDGHTASLFPDDASLEETNRWVAAVDRPTGKPQGPSLCTCSTGADASRIIQRDTRVIG